MSDNPKMVIRAAGIEALGAALDLLIDSSGGDVKVAFQQVKDALEANVEPLDDD